jgi:PTS system beta-glucosides-specific IIC component
MAKDFGKLASSILDSVGGVSNIRSVVHCMTRLRFNLVDQKVADDESIKKLPGISGLVKAGGLYQVIVGPDVPMVYAELTKLGAAGDGGVDVNEHDEGPLTIKKVLNSIISIFSKIMGPIILPMCGIGIITAIASVVQLAWGMATGGAAMTGAIAVIYHILDACSKGLFYFLPFLIIVSASKVFKLDPMVGLVVIGALIYAELNGYLYGIIVIPDGSAEGWDLLKAFSYTGNMLIPIFIALFGGYLYRFLMNKLPGVIRTFFAPALTVLVLVPASIFVIGPVFGFLGLGLSLAFNGLSSIPVVGLPLFGFIMGFFWQILVIFGVHGLITPFLMLDLAAGNPTFIIGPMMLAVLTQFAAVLAISLKIKNKDRKATAVSAAVSAAFGITEPTIYGFTLPKKTPFFIAAGAAALGGLFFGIFGLKGGMAGQGFFFLLGYLEDLPSFLGAFLITAASLALVIIVVFITYKPEEQDLINAAPQLEAKDLDRTNAIIIQSPIEGRVIPLSSAKDQAFRSGALGSGAAILPEVFKHVTAPVSGKLVTVFPTGHAFCILTKEGVEVMVHIGVDTVKLNGKGFTIKSIQGKDVKAGDEIIEVDKDAIALAGYSNETYVVITNSGDYPAVAPVLGKVKQNTELVVIQTEPLKQGKVASNA